MKDKEKLKKTRLKLIIVPSLSFIFIVLAIFVYYESCKSEIVGSDDYIPVSIIFLILTVIVFNCYQYGWGKRAMDGYSWIDIKGYCIKITVRILLVYFILFFIGFKFDFIGKIMFWPAK